MAFVTTDDNQPPGVHITGIQRRHPTYIALPDKLKNIQELTGAIARFGISANDYLACSAR